MSSTKNKSISIYPVRISIRNPNWINNTVPTSAIPKGIPGCPEFAFSTDEAERTLMDLVTLSNTD